MKIKSLFLGSAAAVALSSGAMAADPIGIALDTCSMLNITGLVVSSESNCLKFSGEVGYDWTYTNDENEDGTTGDYGTTSDFDWEFTMEATAESDFGPAKAVVTLVDNNNVAVGNPVSGTIDAAEIDEAYVSIGDQTVIMAGKKGSVVKDGDDETFTALFDLDVRDAAGAGDDGIWAITPGATGGHVMQITSDLGNGVDVALGLEDLQTNNNASLVAGVGVDQDWGTAHIGFVYDDILSGTSLWDFHAGATFNIDDMSFRAAFATDEASNWIALVTGKATFDMFTLAAGVEFQPASVWEASVSGEAEVNDAVTIAVAGRWDDLNNWDIAAQGVFAVSDNLDLTAKVNFDESSLTVFNADLDWAPGGDFEAGVGVQFDSNSVFEVSTSFSKSFE
ncbi:hypothetical protein MXMO3_02315 [Maritalea myrionectae]|uniref:Porin domain-containing protein n=2 Tax=Maritalea myrionectae TaxID=454601 RepID=A0A2R4MFL3_9HYPH|nr:hypothetical protein MXMO3_02315 [Maritalea myrionectae]